MGFTLDRPLTGSAGLLLTIIGGAVVGVSAGRAPGLTIAAVIGLILATIAFYSLTFGLALITVLTFLETIPSVGGGVTFVKLAGVVVTVSWVVLALDRRSEIRLLFRDQPAFSYAVLLFLSWASASVLWAADTSVTAVYVARLALVVVLLFVAYSAIQKPSDVRLVLWAFVAGVFAATLYGIVSGLTLGNGARLIGAIANPNDLAAVLVPAIIFAAVLAATARTSSGRILALIVLATCIIGVFMTQSRGGLVGLTVGLATALIYGGPLRPHALALILIVSSVAVTYYFTVPTPTERARLSRISSAGSSGRTDEWRIALRIAKDHPITGVGMDNFRKVESRYFASDVTILQIDTVLKLPATHNIYLQALAELGIVGAVLLLGILSSALVIGVRSVRRLAAAGDREMELLGRGIVIAVVALLAVDVFDNALLKKGTWLTLGLLLSLSAIARRAETAADAAALVSDQPRPPALAVSGG